ncbi:somatostatin receptor type 2-like [Patiria miniata]|uniref:G-protein coupled receptors family 1 profile domain-containing protein n=1 Tax=Patiria miniata TaxID=46514 RepID=A0A913ZRK1_PATMI|nr:somatostatin receptor type 2-like [Patiria miniata]
MGASLTSAECTSHVNISQEQVSLLLYTPLDTAMITTFIPTTWCLGLITNLSFLFVMYRVPKLRSDTNLYLAHMAIADFLYLSIASVLQLLTYTSSRVAFNNPIGNTALYLTCITIANTGYFGSISLVTMVSLERYLALCHPMKHLTMRGRRRTYKMIAICWLLGLLFTIPISLANGVNNVSCLKWPDDDAYQGFPTTWRKYMPVTPEIYYYLPPLLDVPWLIAMVSNSYMYVRIFQTLNKRTEEGGVASNDQNAIRVRNQVAKMLIVNGVVFFLCQTPYRIINLSYWICLVAKIPNPLQAALGNAGDWVAQVPQYINGMINPLIYGTINKTVRAAFIQVFCCRTQIREQGVAAISHTAPLQKNATPQTSVTDANTDTKL